MDGKTLEKLCVTFVSTFYKAYDADRSKLKPFYDKDNSSFTFSGQTSRGAEAITSALLDKIKAKKVKHTPKDCNFHPIRDGVLILVCGDMFIDDNEAPVKFSETFILGKGPGTSFVILSDIFTLNYG